MKAKDVKIGSVYVAKVSGKIAHVRIVRVREVWSSGDRSRTVWDAMNLATGRAVLIRSAQRLREEVPCPS